MTTNTQPRAATFTKEPKRTRDIAELQRIYQRYIRMGFSEQEARFKAMTHHTYKI